MIDDIRDVSRVEKERALARRKFSRYFGQCFLGAIGAGVGMMLFAFFIVGDFMASFTKASVLATTGRIVTAVALMMI